LNVFQAVKERITTRQAAEYYGLDIKRNGMTCCPFHDDRNPSMKVDNRFHCFGCGEDGDVINFAEKLFSLSPKKAAQKLAYDFGISYDNSERYQLDKQSIAKRIEKEKYKSAENRVFGTLCNYARLLKEWRIRYAPKTKDEIPNPLFVEALLRSDYVDYLLDILISGTAQEKSEIVADYGKEVSELDGRISEYKCTADRDNSTELIG